jgi:iron complex outermembrane recepter protein
MKLFSTTIVLLVVVTLLPIDSAQSAEVQPTNAPTELPPVTVIGHTKGESLTSPSPEQAAKQKTQIPGGFSVQGNDDMYHGRASNFEDLLQGTPGLFLQSENESEVSKISLRGSGIDSADEPLGVEFLLDGMSFQQGDGEVILEDFDVDTIKYAEVYRGANAFQYGGLTLGGAINLVPYTGYDSSPFQARLEAGSYGFLRGQVSSGGVDGPLDYYTSLMSHYRDGYRDHSHENTELWFGDFGYKIDDNLENRFYVTVDHTDRELPGALTKEQLDHDPTAADPNAVAQNWDKEWIYFRFADKISYAKDGQQLDAGLYWWHRDLEEKGFFSPTDFQQGIQTYNSDNLGINLDSITRNDLFGQRNILTIGLVAATEREADHNFANLAGSEGTTIAQDVELSVNVPFYAQNQHYLTEQLSLVTGIQVVYALRDFTDLFNNTLDGNQSHQQNFYGVNPKVGMIYEFNDKDQAFLNFSGSWQPPSFDNMVNFDDGPGVSLVYTPLQPQQAYTVELGTRGEQGRLDWDLALYHSWVHNELQDLYDAMGNDRGDVNVHSAYHQGIEAGLGIVLLNSVFVKGKDEKTSDHLKLDQTYTLNDFHFDNDPVYHNNRLGGIPIHLYEADLMYEMPCGFYAGPNVRCNLTPYPVDQQNLLDADSYALLGFKIGLQRAKGFSVFVEADNLIDERYASSVDPIPNGASPSDPQVFHPGDGRSFYGGVAWSW